MRILGPVPVLLLVGSAACNPGSSPVAPHVAPVASAPASSQNAAPQLIVVPSATAPLPPPVSADCGDHGELDGPRTHDRNKVGAPSCVATRGCSAIPSVTFPFCPPDMYAVAASDLDDQPLEDGVTVAVYGKLNKTLYWGRGGWQMECPGCCDKRRMFLGIADVRSDEWPWFVMREERFRCEGDESMTCCRTNAVCRTVIARGRVRKSEYTRQRRDGTSLEKPVYELLDPEVCIVAGPPP